MFHFTVYRTLSHIFPVSYYGTVLCRQLNMEVINNIYYAHIMATGVQTTNVTKSPQNHSSRYRVNSTKTKGSFRLHETQFSSSKIPWPKNYKRFLVSLKKKAACQTLPNSISFKYNQACLKMVCTDFLPVGNHSRQGPNSPVEQQHFFKLNTLICQITLNGAP